MIFQMTEDLANGERTYTLKVNDYELLMATLERYDRMFIAECESSGRVSDKLLALETIARRIEENAPTLDTTVREER